MCRLNVAEANAFSWFCYSPRPLLYPCRDQSADSHSLAAPIALTFVCRLRCALTELHLSSLRESGSSAPVHHGARCPSARRGPLPALGSHGANGNFILSFPNGSSWLSSPKVRPSTDAPALAALLHLRHPRRRHRDHHRHRRLRPPSSPTVSLSPPHRRHPHRPPRSRHLPRRPCGYVARC